MDRYANEDRARHLIDELLTVSEINAICSKIRQYSDGLFIHCIDVAFISAQIAFELNLPDWQVREIVAGALIHDVGKILIPKFILNKPGSLSHEEYEVIKNHPFYGYEYAKQYLLSDIVLDIIRHHHETETGGGYPDGSTDMFIETKIVSVADKYDAITSKRAYKESCSKELALTKMKMFEMSFSGSDVIYDALKHCKGI